VQEGSEDAVHASSIAAGAKCPTGIEGFDSTDITYIDIAVGW